MLPQLPWSALRIQWGKGGRGRVTKYSNYINAYKFLTWHYISIIPCALCCRKRALCSDKMLSLQALICSGRLPVIYTQFDGTARFFTAANLWQVLSLQKKNTHKKRQVFLSLQAWFLRPGGFTTKKVKFSLTHRNRCLPQQHINVDFALAKRVLCSKNQKNLVVAAKSQSVAATASDSERVWIWIWIWIL